MQFFYFRLQNNHNWQSVAERINELERQHSNINKHVTSVSGGSGGGVGSAVIGNNNNAGSGNNEKYTFLDPSKTHRVSNPTLKQFQKNAVQSYFERQQQQTIVTSQSASSQSTATISNGSIIRHSSGNSNQQSRPQSLQLIMPSSSNKTSSRASLPNYGSNNSLLMSQQQQQQHSYYQLSSSNQSPVTPNGGGYNLHYARQVIPEVSMPPPPPPRNRAQLPTRRTSSAAEYTTARDLALQSKQNLSKDLLQPMIMGQIISVDDWVPERPPKNPLLRIPSPDLPPPPPNVIIETEVQLVNQDEPLPPPPPELLRHMRQLSEPESKLNMACRRNSFAGSTNKKTLYRASTFDNLSPPLPTQPPVIPRKSISNEILSNLNRHNLHQQSQRSSSSLSKHSPLNNMSHHHHHQQLKQHKVILNGNKMDQLIMPMPIPGRLSDSRLSLRKRTHNSNTPIELATASPSPVAQQQQLPSSNVIKKNIPPPPLKPRMPSAYPEMKHFSSTSSNQNSNGTATTTTKLR